MQFSEIGHAVSISINMYDFANNPTVGVKAGFMNWQFHKIFDWMAYVFDSVTEIEPCGQRSEDIATVECGARKESEETWMISVEYPSLRIPRVDECEDAVIRSDEIMPGRVNCNNSSTCSYTGIYDCQVNSALRVFGKAGSKCKSSELNVVGRYFVTDVDDLT